MKNHVVSVEYFKGHVPPRLLSIKKIRLGNEITPDVKMLFSCGQCHALAAALHEILGWPILGCYHCGYDDIYKGSPNYKYNYHFVLSAPTKRPLTADIDGVRCVDYSLRKASYKQIISGRLTKFLEPNMEFARHYAPIIARELKEQCKGR